jgi:hypothetical protein
MEVVLKCQGLQAGIEHTEVAFYKVTPIDTLELILASILGTDLNT